MISMIVLDGITSVVGYHEEMLSFCATDVEEFAVLKFSKTWRFKFRISSCTREFLWSKLLFLEIIADGSVKIKISDEGDILLIQLKFICSKFKYTRDNNRSCGVFLRQCSSNTKLEEAVLFNFAELFYLLQVGVGISITNVNDVEDENQLVLYGDNKDSPIAEVVWREPFEMLIRTNLFLHLKDYLHYDFGSFMFIMHGDFSSEMMSGIRAQNSEEKAQIRLCLLFGPALESYVLPHKKLHSHYCFEEKEYYSIQDVLWYNLKISCLMGKALRSIPHEGYMWITPWVSTAGAGMLVRRFPAVVRLANGKILYACGESLYPGKSLKTSHRRLEVGYITGRDKGSEFCLRRSLPRETIQGKTVLKAADVHLMIIARGTPGFSGTEWENMVNVAALKAAVEGAKDVTTSGLEFFKEKIMMGGERKSARMKLSYSTKVLPENMGQESKLITLVKSLEHKRWFPKVGFLSFMGKRFQTI